MKKATRPRQTAPLGTEPRGLTREQAAAYAGCQTLSTFNDWIRRGILPRPIPGTHVWDRRAIDAALDQASGIPTTLNDDFDEWKARRDARAAKGRPFRQDASR